MKGGRCKDSSADRDFEVRAGTKEEIMTMVAEYARTAHDMPEVTADMASPGTSYTQRLK